MTTSRPPKSEDGDTRETIKPEKPEHDPTDSHVISKVDQNEKGLAQKAGEVKEVSDIGWGASPAAIEEQITPGLSNEDLWLLIRRFDKQLYYVKAVPDTPLQRLDLVRAEDENFSPDKLRATLERFYTTVVIGLVSSVKHITRLRSWREQERTSAFCAVYFVAWFMDLLAPTFFIVLFTLVMHSPAREVLFPPAPIALVDTSTGGAKKPQAGYLGSHDSVTGASEKFKGEAAEKEASNIVASVASLAVGSVAGKNDQGTIENEAGETPEHAEEEKPGADPTETVTNAADARTAAHGESPAETHDKTRQPIKETVFDAANQSMRVLSDVTNTYERFGNALSPTPPFSFFTPHLRLAVVLGFAVFASFVTSSHVFVKTSTFLFGFGFFGDPVIRRTIGFLDRRYTNWRKLLELQNTLLRGIPTNAQLTLTLLRIGEANHAPLPPPPNANSEPTTTQPTPIQHHGASDEEIRDAAAPDPHAVKREHEEETQQAQQAHKQGFIPRVISFFRGTTATGVVSKFAADRVRAAAGSSHAKTRVGILRSKEKSIHPSGPVEFDARYKGKRGTAVIDSHNKSPPLLYFTTEPVADMAAMPIEDRRRNTVLFKLPVSEITEMRKTGGLGWKGKLVVGWAVGGKEIADGLMITGKRAEERYQLTAMSMRNQLFDRLIAIDGQVWK